MRPRQLPTEPMYLILNVDSSPAWGWPSHVNCTYEEEVLGCECCFDCKSLACTRCMAPVGENGSLVNLRAWFADLCDTLPAYYEIDWMRVWQEPSAVKTSCDPPSHPTREWIEGHADDFKLYDMDAPLQAVVPGGEPCAGDRQRVAIVRPVCAVETKLVRVDEDGALNPTDESQWTQDAQAVVEDAATVGPHGCTRRNRPASAL